MRRYDCKRVHTALQNSGACATATATGYPAQCANWNGGVGVAPLSQVLAAAWKRGKCREQPSRADSAGSEQTRSGSSLRSAAGVSLFPSRCSPPELKGLGARRRLSPSKSGGERRPLNARSGIELLLNLGEEKEHLRHRIGDRQKVDELVVLEPRLPFQVVGSEVAHHLAAIAGEVSRQPPGHPIVGLHRVDERKEHAVDALAEG